MITTKEAIQKLNQVEQYLAYQAKVNWDEGESTEAVTLEYLAMNVNSALSYLEAAQERDKAAAPSETTEEHP